ncbi:MAG: putative inner membrane protein Smp [Candidatus Erwinia impunctatus]|nr:putative inner membrane protein Smp [Culicoides impunctatus]
MTKTKLTFKLHRTVIILIALALLVGLTQGVSWFSLSHQMVRTEQNEDLAEALTRQVAFSLLPLMDNSDDTQQKIQRILTQLTSEQRILDASVYNQAGVLVARSGESITVRDRMALNGQRAGSYFNQQIVQPMENQDGLKGFLRITLDTHVLATEAKQVDNTTNILRLMILMALAIGIVLSRLLLSGRSHWQQSPFLLTASQPIDEEEEPPGKAVRHPHAARHALVKSKRRIRYKKIKKLAVPGKQPPANK